MVMPDNYFVGVVPYFFFFPVSSLILIGIYFDYEDDYKKVKQHLFELK